jgi:hypothetical protein
MATYHVIAENSDCSVVIIVESSELEKFNRSDPRTPRGRIVDFETMKIFPVASVASLTKSGVWREPTKEYDLAGAFRTFRKYD